MAEKTGRVSRQRSGPQELYSRKRVRKRRGGKGREAKGARATENCS